jgi:hypothetical protein
VKALEVPFGNELSPEPAGGERRYQQVYSAEKFPGVFEIRSILFPIYKFGVIATGASFDITLHLTNKGRDGSILDGTNFDNNLGGGPVAHVFSGSLTAPAPGTEFLEFNLSEPFLFGSGYPNLILDVKQTGGVNTADPLFLKFSRELGAMSAAENSYMVFADSSMNINRLGSGEYRDAGWGLMTTFRDGPIESPEPATFVFCVLAGAALLAFARYLKTA